MVIVLGDLIADMNMRLPRFPIEAGGIHRLSYLEVGPGGATNIAIMAARFGLQVGCLGEVGDDQFGDLVLGALQREGVGVSGVVVSPGAQTPLAGVVVDATGEPAYLGHPGSLRLMALPRAWRAPLQETEAVFADGWAEHQGVPDIILEAFRIARAANVPTFFDPGPGNPDVDSAWVDECLDLTTVLLANGEEARRLTGLSDHSTAAEALLARGIGLVVIKQGAQGCLLMSKRGVYLAGGLPVKVLDTTGAGDSLAGAVIYAYLNGFSLQALGTLANATGAAKVKKLGTGHNMPTLAEIAEVMGEHGINPTALLPQPRSV